MKTVRICFKQPDLRAGQMVELDEAGAQRAIDNGEADPVTDEEWEVYQRQIAQAERSPVPRKTHGKGK